MTTTKGIECLSISEYRPAFETFGCCGQSLSSERLYLVQMYQVFTNNHTKQVVHAEWEQDLAPQFTAFLIRDELV